MGQTSSGQHLTDAARMDRLEKLNIYRNHLPRQDPPNFNKRLQHALSDSSATQSVPTATEHTQQVQGSLSEVQRRNAPIKELQDQNQQVLENIAGALESQKGSLTSAQTSIVQLNYASMESGSDAEEGDYTTCKRSASSAGLALRKALNHDIDPGEQPMPACATQVRANHTCHSHRRNTSSSHLSHSAHRPTGKGGAQK